MNFIFCFLLPSVLGMILIQHLNKELNFKNSIIYYLLLLLLSNFICFGIIIVVNKFDGDLILYAAEHLKFAFKYISLSMIINLILSLVISIFIKYININLDLKYEGGKIEKAKKQKKNKKNN